MTRFSCAALAALTLVSLSSIADARTHAARDRTNPPAGAFNSVTDEMSIRQQCYAQAKDRWSSTNQDMQTNRDFAYRTCAVERGVRNP